MKNSLVIEKINQAVDILKQKNIDAWLIFVRESHSLPDPSLEMILGVHCTWQSAFIITATGETIAIVGSLDVPAIKDTGAYQEVIPYTKSIEQSLIATINRLNPNKIAINYSTDSHIADGLTHGMYLLLNRYLEKTLYAQRLVSSEEIMAALRGKKSATELNILKEAVDLTLDIFDRVTTFVKPGLTEKEIAQFILKEVAQEGVELAWDPVTCPAVFTGPDTAGAHFNPTDRRTMPGHIMNIDFGIKINGYCSDLQRTWYFRRPGEIEAPAEVQRGFNTIRDAIQKAAAFLKPGVAGWEVDNVARQYIVSQGYDEYPHGLGHQIGRSAHDGAGGLFPRWERYNNLPFLIIESGQVYTIEPRLTCPGYGVVTMEEEVVVTATGCEFISKPQQELILI
jgi:Xaa-Pro aminopeptidase